jgi:UDP-N-acetyl-D-galactosamine dehydrogenase
VGGHCIGVDPYYLSYKAESLGIDSKVINVSRFINDRMAHYVSRKILQHILKHTPNVAEAKVLVKGVTFKENVSDIRNSKVADVIKELKSYNIRVDIEDPHAIKEDVLLEYGFDLTSSPENDYDAVIINVPHKEFKELDSHYFESITKPHGLIADLRGVYRNKIINRKYWSL